MAQIKNVIKDNYNMMLLNDFLREEIKESGFHRVEISKTHFKKFLTHFFLTFLEIFGDFFGNFGEKMTQN